MFQRIHGMCFLVGLGLLVLPAPFVLAAGADDFDLKLVSDQKTYRQGDTIKVEATITTRLEGVQGWSFGVRHDNDLLAIDLEEPTDGDDLLALDPDQIIKRAVDNQSGVGWYQAVLLSIGVEPKVLPVTEDFVMAGMEYKVREGICGAQEDISTSIYLDGTLKPGDSPTAQPIPVDLSFDGGSITPTVQQPAEVTILCPSADDYDVMLKFELPVDRKLIANQQNELDVNVILQNRADDQALELLGWSYGVKMDDSQLGLSGIRSGSAVEGLNPDFRTYTAEEVMIVDGVGGARGFTVAVVINLDSSSDVLAIPPTQERVIEVLTVKSAVTLGTGDPDETTQLEFADQVFPANRPVEILFTTYEALEVGLSEDPDPQDIVLTPPAGEVPFIRGYANPDDTYDIADPIWTIQVLFYQIGSFDCLDAADTNDDGLVDLADVIYTINYQLQPGKQMGGASFPKPPPPFDTCGNDPTGDEIGCEVFSHCP